MAFSQIMPLMVEANVKQEMWWPQAKLTRHLSDSCGCEFLKVDEDLLADCLKKGC